MGGMSVEIEDAGDGTRVCVDVQGRLEPEDAHDLAAAIVLACGHLSEKPRRGFLTARNPHAPS